MSKLTRRLGVLATTSALALTTVGAATPTLAADSGRGAGYTYAPDGKTTDPKAAATVRKLRKSLPANWQAKLNAMATKTGIERGPVSTAVLKALMDEPCRPTELDAYVERLLRGIPDDVLFALAVYGVFDYPAYDALFFGDRDNPEYALTPGTTGKVRQTMATARTFWNIPNGDIQVLGMDSEMVTDRDRVIRIVQFLFGVSEAEATEFADDLIPLMLAVPGLRGGDNPIFSLNAYAFSDPTGELGVSDRIVMGEGIIKALRYSGDIEVGPQMVFSHEFGHHIQYETGVFDGLPDTPESTRYAELMADAYATYLDAHREGLNFNSARVKGAIEVAHLVGDCSTDSLGHHGTPAQRARAAAWGASYAKANGTNVKTAQAVRAAFDKALPGILGS